MRKFEPTSVRGQLYQLKVGEKAVFDASRTSYIRNNCTNFGFEWDRKFSTSTDRETRTITVTRER